jgi:nucleotide-binding universal stress UspA family protein
MVQEGGMKILCTLDGSDESEAILPAVRTLAAEAGASVTLLTVLSAEASASIRRVPEVGPVFATGAGAIFRDRTSDLLRNAMDAEAEALERRNEKWRSEALSYLSEVSVQLREAGIETEIQALLSPHVAETIVDVARAAHADLIAMATHGQSGLSGLIHGSVAGHVLRYSVAPVLLVRPEMP